MKTSVKRVIFGLFSVLALMGGVQMATASASQATDDVVALAQKGVGEEILLATVETAKSGFNLSAADILKLKDAKVSDKVITAMIKHKGTAAEVVAAPETKSIITTTERIGNIERKEVAPIEDVKLSEGTLNIENLDDRAWAYTYESESKTLWITAANGVRGKLDAHAGTSLRMNAGTYKVRYNGQDNGPMVTVLGGEKSQLLLSRVENAQGETLYVSVFEKGERKSGGRLAVLRENTPAANPAPAPATKDVYVAPASVAPAAPQTVERVVERERVVEVPRTTVVYRDVSAPVVYVGPTYYEPRYYSGYCSSYYSPYYYGSYGCSDYRYSGYYHGPRTSISVGVGFGHHR